MHLYQRQMAERAVSLAQSRNGRQDKVQISRDKFFTGSVHTDTGPQTRRRSCQARCKNLPINDMLKLDPKPDKLDIT